jgi:hypothetical protein
MKLMQLLQTVPPRIRNRIRFVLAVSLDMDVSMITILV